MLQVADQGIVDQVGEEVESISRLWRIVAILLAKKSAKAWEGWTVDGRGED